MKILSAILTDRSDHLGQVIKGMRRMTWHWEPMKVVISCEKLRVGANIH